MQDPYKISRDVFLCHADVDKKEHVRPLADALSRRAVSCWLDEVDIPAGDSILKAVQTGLAGARYVIPVITENFSERQWTQEELDVALSQQIGSGVRTVLPILAMDKAEYRSRFPLLSGKRYLVWESDPEALADKIAALFKRKPCSEWHQFHPEGYTGPVWVRVLHQSMSARQPHHLTLRWGRYVLHLEFLPESKYPRSFHHTKIRDDGIPLLASIEPPSIVTFGTGAPPDLDAEDINDGWIKSCGNGEQVVPL